MTTECKCKGCGNCCTNLLPSVPGAPGGLLLTPEETSVFVGHAADHIVPTVAYTAPGSEDMVIIYYGMISAVCPLYDPSVGCTVYGDRPLVCVKYPFASSMNCGASCPNADVTTDKFGPHYHGAQALFAIRTQKIIDDIPPGATLYIYNVINKEWDITGVKQ